MMQLNGYPADHGFYFPAEWEEHRATWLTYPANSESWNKDELHKVREEFHEFIRIISLGEQVKIFVQDEQERQALQDKLVNQEVEMPKVQIFIQPANDCWSRDYAPFFLVNRKKDRLAALGCEFNGWGNKYQYDLDNQLKWTIIEKENRDYFKTNMVLEGGSVELNGDGYLLTTTACLLNKNRNPHLNQDEIERNIKQLLGVHTVLWLENGIAGDDTDGHIDDITRFVSTDKVVTALEEDPADENYQHLHQNYKQLKNLSKKGYFNDIYTIPMPLPPLYHKKDRLPASYANFYVCNAGVIVPIFHTANDEKALYAIEKCFPGKKVYPLCSKETIKGLGSWHCISQQVPV